MCWKKIQITKYVWMCVICLVVRLFSQSSHCHECLRWSSRYLICARLSGKDKKQMEIFNPAAQHEGKKAVEKLTNAINWTSRNFVCCVPSTCSWFGVYCLFFSLIENFVHQQNNGRIVDDAFLFRLSLHRISFSSFIPVFAVALFVGCRRKSNNRPARLYINRRSFVCCQCTLYLASSNTECWPVCTRVHCSCLAPRIVCASVWRWDGHLNRISRK